MPRHHAQQRIFGSEVLTRALLAQPRLARDLLTASRWKFSHPGARETYLLTAHGLLCQHAAHLGLIRNG